MSDQKERMRPKKPLGKPAYGSIPHLIGSNRGPADHGVNEGIHKICTVKCRRHDRVIVTEKLDGSNVSIANIDGKIVPLTRAGYHACDSNFRMHHIFETWVAMNAHFFQPFIKKGERLCGEWMIQAHGTRYDLTNRAPFVAFDLFDSQNNRHPFAALVDIVKEIQHQQDSTKLVVCPYVLHDGTAVSISAALDCLGKHGHHGALDDAEGVVYRVEQNGNYEFMAKFVRNDFVPGRYLGSNEYNIGWSL